MRVKVSVVIPTYRGVATIRDALDSLAAQTLPWPEFEAVVVPNGPDDGTSDVVASWLEDRPGFQLQLLTSGTPGASRARNTGIDAARGEYVAFLDDDDRLRERHLEVLLAGASERVIPVVPVGFVHDDDFTKVDYQNWHNDPIVDFVDYPASPVAMLSALAVVSGKLLRTDLARRVRFDEDLTLGEDRLFWTAAVLEGDCDVRLAEFVAEAAYLYRIRDDSTSRRGGVPSRAEKLVPWLEAIEAHLRLDLSTPDRRRLVGQAVQAMVANFLGNNFLRKRPGEVAFVRAQLESRGLHELVPWRLALRNVGRDLAFIGAGTGRVRGGPPMEERLCAEGLAYDVIEFRSPASRAEVSERFLSHVDKTALVGCASAAFAWSELSGFAEQIIPVLAEWESLGAGPYLRVASVGSDPSPHLLAALAVIARRGARWRVEWLEGPSGEDMPADADWMLEVLGAGMVEAGLTLDSVPSTAAGIAKLVIGLLADEIVFSDERERSRFVASLPDPRAAERALANSRLLGAPAPWWDAPEATRTALSVVVPTYGGDAWLGRCLESLALQTFPAAEFEVLVIENGPASAAKDIVDRVRDAFPGLDIRHLRSEEAGAARARNLGIAEAAGQWITFVDDDDQVGPRYLEELMAAALPGIIPVAPIGLTDEAGGEPEFVNWLTHTLVPHRGLSANDEDLAMAVQSAVAKAVPTRVARQVRFDESLRLGEDTTFWVGVLAQGGLRLGLTAFSADAGYHYTQRAGSATAPTEPSFDFHVATHLDAIAAIDRVQPAPGAPAAPRSLRAVQDTVIGTLAATVRAYLTHRPDEKGIVEAEALARGLSAAALAQLGLAATGLPTPTAPTEEAVLS